LIFGYRLKDKPEVVKMYKMIFQFYILNIYFVDNPEIICIFVFIT